MDAWISQGRPKKGVPTVHIVSDSLGKTGTDIAVACAAQFDDLDPSIEVLSEVDDAHVMTAALEEHLALHDELFGDDGTPFLLFFTLVAPALRTAMKDFVAAHPEVLAVDLLEPVIDALRTATGIDPVGRPGAFHRVNEGYFKRIEAVEFTIAHDDGASPHDLDQADIVLLGVSRSSKTPLSVYLSQQGYKVANIPLDPATEPPREVFELDSRRIFGLVTSPEVLVDIRQRRLAKAEASGVAASYADYEHVCRDLDRARALMRRLGCIVVHTENRAIEETAAEILRYYTSFFPKTRS